MTGPSMADLVRWWPPPPASAHERVVALLCALDGPDARRLPLGRHHQRALEVHRSCVGRPLEAVVTCRHCDSESEFTVPAELVLELAAPGPGASVEIELGGRLRSFRLPDVRDLGATAGLDFPEAVAILAERTALPPAPGLRLADHDVRRLAAAWEEADPAAALTVDLDCAGCGAALTAAVDPVELVSHDLDRLVDRLVGEVHVLASAYGWSEDAVLALPAARRQRYLQLVGAPGRATRPLTSVTR